MKTTLTILAIMLLVGCMKPKNIEPKVSEWDRIRNDSLTYYYSALVATSDTLEKFTCHNFEAIHLTRGMIFKSFKDSFIVNSNVFDSYDYRLDSGDIIYCGLVNCKYTEIARYNH